MGRVMHEYKEIVVYVVIGILATWARLLVAIEKFTVFTLIRTSVTGALIGICVGFGLVEESPLPPWAKYALFGISVSLAEDIFTGILNVGKQIKTNPQAFFRSIWRR